MTWVERDAPAMRVAATCICGRDSYFRYSIAGRTELLVEDTELGGPAVLRCIGCGAVFASCVCPWLP